METDTRYFDQKLSAAHLVVVLLSYVPPLTHFQELEIEFEKDGQSAATKHANKKTLAKARADMK